MNATMHPLPFKKNGTIHHKAIITSVLDVGTSKMSCLISESILTESGRQDKIIGVGHQVSRGIKNGVVVNMVEAEKSIRKAVDVAERMANTRIRSVTIGISNANTQSHLYRTSLDLHGYAVKETHMTQLLQQASDKVNLDGIELLHVIPVRYNVDDSMNIANPTGLFGEILHVTTHAITMPIAPIRNLLSCIDNCHLYVDKIVATAYASSLVSLVDDEMQLGVLAIDIGGGTTSVSIFHESMPLYTATIPIGGYHITTDIARGLNISLQDAERIKTLYGCAIGSMIDDDEQIDVPLIGEIGEENIQKVSLSMISKIIYPRVEEIFEILQTKLEHSDLYVLAGRRAVLTGGGSELSGVCELAEKILDKQVRVGHPYFLKGLPESISGPAFSACVGLLAYQYRHHIDKTLMMPRIDSFWQHYKEWWRKNF